MRTSMTAVTALAGGLFLAPFMLGPSQAESAPDLKNAIGATYHGPITLVRSGGGSGGGGGSHAGGGTSHMSVGASSGGRVGSQASASHRNVSAQASTSRGSSHSQSVSHANGNHSNNRHFANGGAYYGDDTYYYGTDDCYSLRRYSWTRYQTCMGIY
jgi:hypothetical protein